MATASICRRVFDSVLPDGAIWHVAPGEQLDNFYSATALNFEVMRTKAAAVQWLRNARQTACLSDLEIEAGVVPDAALSNAERRAYLAAHMGEKCVLPSWIQLENKLRAAGFDVRVYPNDPPVDPSGVIVAYSGYFLVNGDVLDYQERDYTATVCDTASDDGETTVCDDDGTEDVPDRGDTIGSFSGMLRIPYVYHSPIRYRWPLVFWIAASKTGAETFVDWNMEHHGISNWTGGNDAYVQKSYLWKNSGIRSLEVMATAGWAGAIGPYAEGSVAVIATPRTITVRAMASAGVRGAMVVCDKDGVWDVGGIVQTAIGSTGETLTYNAANGILGVRLYVTTGTGAPVLGDYARFDELQIDNLGFVAASISEKWHEKFDRLVLRYKPLRTWAGVLVNWTAPAPVAGPADEDDK